MHILKESIHRPYMKYFNVIPWTYKVGTLILTFLMQCVFWIMNCTEDVFKINLFYSTGFFKDDDANAINFNDFDKISWKCFLTKFACTLKHRICHATFIRKYATSYRIYLFWVIFEPHYLWNASCRWADFLNLHK